MSKPSEIGEDTKLTLDLKTIFLIVAGAVSIAGTYYSLSQEIEVAKELPKPELSRTEFDLKDELVRSSIISIEEKVNSNSEKLDKIDEKLYEIIQK